MSALEYRITNIEKRLDNLEISNQILINYNENEIRRIEIEGTKSVANYLLSQELYRTLMLLQPTKDYVKHLYDSYDDMILSNYQFFIRSSYLLSCGNICKSNLIFTLMQE